MLRDSYERGIIAALAKFGFDVGLGMGSDNNGQGAVRGSPADQGPRQRRIIDMAFTTNQNLPLTSSTTDEPPNRGP